MKTISFGKTLTTKFSNFKHTDMIQRFLILVFAITLISGCAASKKTVSTEADTKTTTEETPSAAKSMDSIGEWAYIIKDLPDGDVEGTMTIKQAGDKFMGTMKSDLGEVDFESIAIENNQLNSTYSVMGYFIKMTGTFEGNAFNGKISVEGYDFPMTATKKEK